MRALSSALGCLLLSSCYLSHGLSGEAPDAGVRRDAARADAARRDAGAVDAGRPPTPTCDVHISWCAPAWEAPLVFAAGPHQIRFHDMGWSGRGLILAYDFAEEDGTERSRIAGVTLDGRVEITTDVDSIGWPDVAWHPGANVGMVAGSDSFVWLRGGASVTFSEPVEAFGFGAHSVTAAPVRSGFLTFVAPASGGTLRNFYGAVHGTMPGPAAWEIFAEPHVTNVVVPGLDEDGYARYLGTGIFSPQSRVLIRVEDDRPGEFVSTESIGSSAGEAEAVVVIGDTTYTYFRSVAGGVFEVREREAVVRMHTVGEELGVGTVPFARGIDGDALRVGQDIVFTAELRAGGVGIASWNTTDDRAELRTLDSGSASRPLTRLAPTARGFAAAYRCDADLCVTAYECCILE